MGEEFISGDQRWCLWLKDCSPEQLRSMKHVLERVGKVADFRKLSTKAATRALATTPAVFAEIRQPHSSYLAIPRVSSERRTYIPIGFLPERHVAGDKIQTIPNATVYHFGVLSSSTHMAWMRTTTGRLKSDYQYSAAIVYNNFPWPQNITDKQKQAIEETAQAVLDARAKHPEASLADLYDPLTMPPELVKAHQKLDAAVDAAYSKKKFQGDSDRVAFLFELYQQLASPLEGTKKPKRTPKKRA
jgi:hypothetical protein